MVGESTAENRVATLPAGAFTVADGVAAADVDRSTLARWARSGRIERIARGVYRRDAASGADPNLVEAALRVSSATVCLTSALAWHELTDEIPDRLDLAVPRGAWIPQSVATVAWHTVIPAAFNVDRHEAAVPGAEGVAIHVYGPERTIADLLRLPGRRDEGVAALRVWLRRHGSRPAALVRVAEQLPRAAVPVRRALEYLA